MPDVAATIRDVSGLANSDSGKGPQRSSVSSATRRKIISRRTLATSDLDPDSGRRRRRDRRRCESCCSTTGIVGAQASGHRLRQPVPSTAIRSHMTRSTSRDAAASESRTGRDMRRAIQRQQGRVVPDKSNSSNILAPLVRRAVQAADRWRLRTRRMTRTDPLAVPADRRREVDVVRATVWARGRRAFWKSRHPGRACDSQIFWRSCRPMTRTVAGRRGGQLNGGRRSMRREPAPHRRHTRAIQSASSSVTRLPITRTAMFIRNADRIAMGPSTAGTAESSAAAPAGARPRTHARSALQDRRPRRRQITRCRASPRPAGRSPARSRCPRR